MKSNFYHDVDNQKFPDIIFKEEQGITNKSKNHFLSPNPSNSDQCKEKTSPMKFNGARIVVECLKREKVDTIFCYSGGSVLFIFDEIFQHGQEINCIQPRHEQAGTHAADAYARSTGKVGVVLVTSGPGATNTITGIATAQIDSVPLVVLTGQVATPKIGTAAFQEADVTALTRPITKARFLVRSVKDLAKTIKKAFYIAKSGRPGPVVVDIPVDVQLEETQFDYPEILEKHSPAPKIESSTDKIKEAIEMMNRSNKPLVLSGGGVIFSDSTSRLNKWLEKVKYPVVTTLMGHGVNPSDKGLYFGGIGMHGTLYGNYAIQNADLILALGVRFSDRIIGDVKSFAPKAKIIHVDIDASELGKNIKVDLPIWGTIQSVLDLLLKSNISNNTFDWLNELNNYKKNNPLQYSQNGKLKGQQVIEEASRVFPEDTIVAVDVGQNQMWTAQYFSFRYPRSLMSSSGLGTMGYGLPAAIGAKIGNPDREVLMISGDGGFQMNIQELATINKYNLNIKMIILDNTYLGMVRQWQEFLCKKRYSGTSMKDNPDFCRVANAFDIKTIELSQPSALKSAIKQLAQSSETRLLHAKIDPDENVFPMVPAGKSLNQVLTKF